ncbi:MAG: hypothetical protein IAF08_04750 [Rhizobacter sp.]|nr:hypothetical protein [Chlorobiales bacterium]
MGRFTILGSILGKERQAWSHYRGLDRSTLPEMPKDGNKLKAINEAFAEFLEQTDASVKDGEYLDSYEVAEKIARIYTANNETGEKYEIIEVVKAGEKPSRNNYFLGYDVIMTNEGNNSTIIDYFSSTDHRDNFISLYEKYLNNFFLFEDLTTAKEFSLLIKKRLDDGMEFEIIGLYASAPQQEKFISKCYSTVTDLARLRG